MNKSEALKLVEQHGIMLESADGATANFVAQVAGENITGSWWNHPMSHQIFALTRAVREAEDVLVCRVIQGKITYVHRCLWVALVHFAEDLPASYLSSLEERHSVKGYHEVVETQFPDWVPEDILALAKRMSQDEAMLMLDGRIPGIK